MYQDREVKTVRNEQKYQNEQQQQQQQHHTHD